MEWKNGMVVRSLCGRDKDRLLCVLGEEKTACWFVTERNGR